MYIRMYIGLGCGQMASSELVSGVLMTLQQLFLFETFPYHLLKQVSEQKINQEYLTLTYVDHRNTTIMHIRMHGQSGFFDSTIRA